MNLKRPESKSLIKRGQFYSNISMTKRLLRRSLPKKKEKRGRRSVRKRG